jgi:hypothetical protein
MFCSGCGRALEPGQAVCPQCNRPVAPSVPPVPGFGFVVDNYAGKIRVLGILWLVYAGLSLLFGFAGILFLHAFFLRGPGLWGFGPMQHSWIYPSLIRFAGFFLVGRAILAGVAGWGLLEHSQWGRIVAILAAILNLFHFFPFGLAMGIATLIILVGARNWTLYDQLDP